MRAALWAVLAASWLISAYIILEWAWITKKIRDRRKK